jgi:hypothetical protein
MLKLQVAIMVTHQLIGGMEIHMTTMTLTALKLLIQRYRNVLILAFLTPLVIHNPPSNAFCFMPLQDVSSREVSKDFTWLGSAWHCQQRLKHYKSFCRRGITISV